ncbi:MAG: hypothetical protein J5636_08485 [Clostridiales bacterium]|nr:hypothetical protein [Clostridiales bacterium]
MLRVKPTKTHVTRQFMAFLLLATFLVSALPFLWFTRIVTAAEPLPETGNKVYHDEEYFELYHTMNGEPQSKILEYLFAETVEEGQTRPVYCVKAGAPTPESGSIEPAMMDDPAAAALLGKIQYIIEMDDSVFEVPDTVNEHPYIHYYVRQILIWNLVYLYQDELGSEAQSYFRGIDLDSFIDGEGSGPTAVKILAEAKRLWEIYDEAGRPALTGAYTPNYKAVIGNRSEVDWSAKERKFYATFTVTVRETVKGNEGGTFRFSNVSGGKVYLLNADGSFGQEVNTSQEYPSGSTFAIAGNWREMSPGGQQKEFAVDVLASGNGNNERSQLMYGYFFDSGLSASGLPRQTYVGWHISSRKTFSSSGTDWSVEEEWVELTKQSVFESVTIPEEGAEFQVYHSDYGSFDNAKKDSLGFECVSDGQGKIIDKTTEKMLLLPPGTYMIRQTKVPEGTKEMTPNPATFTVSGSTARMTFSDEIRSGCFAIEKKIVSGYDDYAGTTWEDLTAEEGASFQVWNTKYNSYDAAPSNYRDLLTTDADGYAKSKILPYGEYCVHQIESEATKYSFVCDDTTVSIRGTNASAPQDPEQVLKLENRQYELKIQIRKVDSRTGQTVPAAGVEFQVLDEEENILSDWDGNDIFVTGEDGTASLEKLGLSVGVYYIREKTAPVGFVLNEELVRIEAKKGESFIGVGPEGDMKAVPFADEEVSVELELRKTGERLTSAVRRETGWEEQEGYDFVYTEEALSGAVYELYCDGDVLDFERDISLLDSTVCPEGAFVLSEDGSAFVPYKMFDTDGDGEAETPLKDGTLLGTYTTDDEGRIVVEGLSLDARSGQASYKMVEIDAPSGYLVDSTPVLFVITDDREDQTIRVIRDVESVTDDRQRAELVFEKTGRTYAYDAKARTYISSDSPLAGAVLGIFAAQPILSASGEILVAEGELIEVVTSDEDGICRTSADYPFGCAFYVEELAAPLGYIRSEKQYPLDTTIPSDEQGKERISFGLSEKIVNKESRARIRIVKIAADSSLPMKEVEFEVYTKDGHLVEKLLTDEVGVAVSDTVFPYEEEIVLRETKTQREYAIAEERSMKITEIQMISGEYPYQEEEVLNYRLSEVCVLKTCGDGTKTPMDGVAFQLWEKGVDGKPDVLLMEEKTDEKGELTFFLGEGEYYLVERSVGKWTRFRLNDEPFRFSCGKEGKVQYFEIIDMPTETIAEKRSAGNGELLGGCGVMVKDENGTTLSFLWKEELHGYLACDPSAEGAVTVLYTNRDVDSRQYGMVSILGLPAGNYEIIEVEAPEGYRNDSEAMTVTVGNSGVLGVTRLYDTMKTSEVDELIGYTSCGICGISAFSLFSMGCVEISERIKRRRDDR